MTSNIDDEVQTLEAEIGRVKIAIKNSMLDVAGIGGLTIEIRALSNQLAELKKRKKNFQ